MQFWQYAVHRARSAASDNGATCRLQLVVQTSPGTRQDQTCSDAGRLACDARVQRQMSPASPDPFVVIHRQPAPAACVFRRRAVGHRKCRFLNTNKTQSQAFLLYLCTLQYARICRSSRALLHGTMPPLPSPSLPLPYPPKCHWLHCDVYHKVTQEQRHATNNIEMNCSTYISAVFSASS